MYVKHVYEYLYGIKPYIFILLSIISIISNGSVLFCVHSLDYHSEGTSSSTVHIHYPTEDTHSMERSPPLPPPPPLPPLPPLPDNTSRVTRSCPLPPIEGSIETELHHTCRSEPSTSTSGLIIANQIEDKVDEDENVISDSEHSGAPQSDAGEAIAEPPSENTREDLEEGIEKTLKLACITSQPLLYEIEALQTYICVYVINCN